MQIVSIKSIKSYQVIEVKCRKNCSACRCNTLSYVTQNINIGIKKYHTNNTFDYIMITCSTYVGSPSHAGTVSGPPPTTSCIFLISLPPIPLIHTHYSLPPSSLYLVTLPPPSPSGLPLYLHSWSLPKRCEHFLDFSCLGSREPLVSHTHLCFLDHIR